MNAKSLSDDGLALKSDGALGVMADNAADALGRSRVVVGDAWHYAGASRDAKFALDAAEATGGAA